MTIEEFAQLVARHDLTFMYSDDPYWYHRGSQELAEIKAFGAFLPREDVVRIWNSEVDRKLVEGARESFYWKV